MRRVADGHKLVYLEFLTRMARIIVRRLVTCGTVTAGTGYINEAHRRIGIAIRFARLKVE